MEPTFKLMCKGVLMGRTFRKSNIIDTKQFAIVIEMGDRKIVLRAATGEQGEKGPFPFVELQEKGKDPVSDEPYHFSGGFCLTQESEFDDLWKFLEARCR